MTTPAVILTTIDDLSRREAHLVAASRGGEMPADLQSGKVAALLDAARALDAAGIAYALIGGLAVGVHSRTPRATLDVDLAVPSTIGAERIATELEGAGFRRTGAFPHSVNFRHPGGEPLQVAFDPAFDPMIERAETIDVGGVRVRIVGRDDLVAMKERAAADPARRKSKRLRDQADVEMLRGDVPDPDEGW